MYLDSLHSSRYYHGFGWHFVRGSMGDDCTVAPALSDGREGGKEEGRFIVFSF